VARELSARVKTHTYGWAGVGRRPSPKQIIASDSGGSYFRRSESEQRENQSAME